MLNLLQGLGHSSPQEQGTQNWEQQLHLSLYLIGTLNVLVHLFLCLRVGKHEHLRTESMFPVCFNSGSSRALLSCWNMPGSTDFQQNKPVLQN